MEILEKHVIKQILDYLKENPEMIADFDIGKAITDATPPLIKEIKASLNQLNTANLDEHRSRSSDFVSRNINRWKKAFDVLETLVLICTEAGDEFNTAHRPKAAAEGDLVFDLVVRHHARACQIAQEILCLLKNGFADAAHARWRALHEVTATAIFLAKHGNECAVRFYFHDVVDSYHGMLEHKKYENRLQAKGPSDEEIANCKVIYDSLIEKYGSAYRENYGWAAYLFPTYKRVGFGAIEKDVRLDHMRPYYKWASQNIHAGSKAMKNRLGLCEAKDNILLVGRSNSGMTDPAHAMAISLSQVTVTLLCLQPTIDYIVISNIIRDLSRDVGATFLETDKVQSF